MDLGGVIEGNGASMIKIHCMKSQRISFIF